MKENTTTLKNEEISAVAEDKMNPKKKKAIIICSIVSVVVLIAAVLTIMLTSNSVSTTIYNKAVLGLMPNTITGVTADGEMTFYVKSNKDYDAKKDGSEPINAFVFYYKDKDGKDTEVDTAGNYVDSSGTKHNVMLGFFAKGLEKLRKIQAVLKVVAVVMGIILLGVLIYLWYLNWCKREKKRKELEYGTK